MTTRRHDSDYPENETSTQAWWDEKDARMRADIAADREYAKTADAIAHQLSIHDGAIVRESMDPERWEAQRAVLVAKLDAARAREKAEYEAAQAIIDAEWTAEVTAARRATWNAHIRSGALNLPNGKINPAKLSAYERSLGWGREDLKRAVERHTP